MIYASRQNSVGIFGGVRNCRGNQAFRAWFQWVKSPDCVKLCQFLIGMWFEAKPKKPRPTGRQIIATLLELIKDPVAERQQIVLRCQRSGVAISRELVDGVFAIAAKSGWILSNVGVIKQLRQRSS